MKRNNIIQLAFATLATFALLGVTACGVSGTAGSSAGGQPTATASTTATSPLASTPRTGGFIVQGQVTVTLDKLAYTSTDPITIYVNNGLDTSISVADHQTACTIVSLQQSLGAAWKTVGTCRLMTPTRLIEIPGHTITPVHLGGSAAQLAHYPWPAGTYRVALTYASPSPGGSSPVYSAQFQIQ